MKAKKKKKKKKIKIKIKIHQKVMTIWSLGESVLKVVWSDTFESTPDLHRILSAGGFWQNNIVNVLELKTFQLRNKKKKCNRDFLLNSLFAKKKNFCIGALKKKLQIKFCQSNVSL